MQPSRFPGIDDQLDELVAQNQGVRANRVQPTSSRYPAIDLHLGEIQTSERLAVENTLDLALPRNPDKAAEAQTLADRFKLDMATVQAKQDELARIARGEDIRKSLAASPILRRQMTDMRFAEIAHDDVETLSGMERTFKNVISDVGVTALKGAVGLPQAFLGLADIVSGGEIGAGAKALGVDFSRTQKILGDAYSPVQKQRNKEVSDAEGFFGTVGAALQNPSVIGRAALESLPQMLGGAAVSRGLLSGASALSPLAAGAIGEGVIGAGSAVSQMQGEQGDSVSIKQALSALGSGAGTAVFGLMGGKLAQRLGIDDIDTALARGGFDKAAAQNAKTMFVGRLGAAGVSEGVFEELPQSAQEQMWQNFATDRPIMQGVAEAAAFGMVVGAVTGGAFEGVRTTMMRKDAQATAAMQNAEALGRLGDLVKASKALSRSPQSVAQFVQEAAKEQGAENVYVDAKVFNQLIQDQGIGLDQIPGPLRDQLAEATARGGDVVIPVGTFATEIASTEYAQALADHVKLDPNGMSRAEAVEFMQTQGEQLQQEVERTLSKQEANSAWQASRDVVKAQILEELNAVGRFTPQKNEADATLFASYYAVRAEQLGVTPEQLYQQRRVKFAAESLGGQELNQVAIDTPEFQNWFGDSKVVDAQGKPLVVYHGTRNEFTTFDYSRIGEQGRAEGAGFYFTNSKDVASGYGAPMEVFLTIKKPLAYDAKPFNSATLQKIVSRVAELEAADEGGDIADGFLANFGDVRSEGLKRVIKTAADMIAADETALDQLSGIVGSGVRPQFVNQATRDVTGFDGVVANGFSNAGGTENRIFVAFFPEQIKSATGNRGTFDPNDPNILNQGARGAFSPENLTITLLRGADLSTALHEGAHFFFENDISLAAELVREQVSPESQNEGALQILADVSALMNFHGITGTIEEQLATWYGMDFEQKRIAHERVAESFEAYLFDGNAPSVELSPYFQRFREWMLSVYKSIKDFLTQNPEAGKLDDTVRGVFDRMLATKEQIEIAQNARSMMPLFSSPEQAGFTVQEFQAYQEMARQSSDAAADELEARALRDMAYSRNARGRELKKLQKEAAELRSEVRIEARQQVMSRPVYMAWSYITASQQEGEKGSNKLFLDPQSQYITPEQAAILKARRMGSKNGMDPDVAVDMIPGINAQFSNGEQLVRALAQAQDMNEAIEELTDKLMLEQHGELATPEAIERSADLAIHNEVRARLVASELNAIQRMAGRPKILATAAKEYAGKMINRLMLANVKPHLYAAAKARAARASEKAFKSGDLQAAAVQKRNELINSYAAVAAKEALAEARAAVKYFNSLTKGSNKKTVERGMDPDVLNAARFILGAYGVGERAAERAADYLDVLRRNNPDMAKVLEPSITAALANARPLEQLTIEQLRGLREEIEAMAHLAKRSRLMEVGGNLLDREEVVAELDAKLEEIGVPEVIPGEKSAITPMEKAKSSLQYAGAILRRVEQWAEAKDGKFGGPFLRYVFQPVKEAADRYRADRSKYRKQYLDLVQSIAPSMKGGLIEAPELGYTFGKGHNGVAMAELLHAVLHTGNESNKRKLLLGRGWAVDLGEGQMDTGRWDAFIDRMHREGILRREHYDFAQGVWDLLDSMKPAAQKTHRDVFGMYFEEVTANEFNTPYGTYRGGYVPAQADPQIVKDASLRDLAEQENQSMAYSFPTTSKGFTKARVEYNRPLKLDLRSLSQHIDKVLLFTHMEPAVRDVNRVITDKGLSTKLARVDPASIDGMLAPWLKRSATQQVETPIAGDGGVSRVLSTIRSRSGMALMFFNISNTMQQITGLPGAANKVRPALLAKAAASYLSSPRAMAENVAQSSIYMKDRMANEVAAINNQMSEILLDPSFLEKGQAWTMKHAYFLQSAFDNVIGPIVWTGAYNQALQQGMTDVDAVRFADGVIRQTQNTTLPEDVSRIETGPAYARLFTQFIGYFNMLANTNSSEIKKVMREVGIKKGAGKVAGIVFFGLLAPAWIAEAIAIAMRGGPEDDDDDGYLDDWLMQVAGLGSVKFALAGVPFVGQFVNAGINRWNGNPVDDRVSLSPAVSLAEGAFGAPYSVYQAMVNDGNASKAVKDVGTAVTLLTGLPAHWAARPLGYVTGIAEERIEPEGPVDVIRGLVTGVASPESRQ